MHICGKVLDFSHFTSFLTDFDGGETCTNLRKENKKLLAFNHILDGRGSPENCATTCRVHHFTEKLVSGMLPNLSLFLRCPHFFLTGGTIRTRFGWCSLRKRQNTQTNPMKWTQQLAVDDGNQQRLEVKWQMLHELVVLVVLFSFLEKGRTSRRKRPGWSLRSNHENPISAEILDGSWFGVEVRAVCRSSHP